MQPLWTRRSVIVFFAIGFGVPWLGWTARTVFDVQGPLATVLFYTGDFMSVAGFVAAYVAAGKPGLVSLAKRYVQFPISPSWALFAWFLPFVWFGAATLVYGASHGGIGRVDPAGLLQYFAPGILLAWTTGPLGEEAGWRGFLLPRLSRVHRPIAGALILGVIWSLWHYPLYWDRVFATADGAIRFTIGTICFSLLMAVLWAYSRGSVFWVMLLHWTINVSPAVVRAVFPDIRPPEGATDWLETGLLLTVTITVGMLVGMRRLDERLRAVISTLTDESIDRDRRDRRELSPGMEVGKAPRSQASAGS